MSVRTLARGRAEWLPLSFLLLLVVQGGIFLAAYSSPPLLLAAAAVILVLTVLLAAPFPLAVGVFVLAGTLFPFTQHRFRLTLSGLLLLLVSLLLSDRFRLALRGRLFSEGTPLAKPVALFVVLIVVSSLHGIARGFSYAQWPLEAFPLACLATAPILARRLTTRSVVGIFLVYAAVMVVESIYAVVMFVQVGFIRLHAPAFQIHPGLAAVVLLAVVAFHEKRKWRVLASLAFLPLFFQVVVTMTRGAWVGVVAGTVAILVMAHRLTPGARFRSLVVGILIGCLVLLAVVVAGLAHWGMLESLDVLKDRADTLTQLGADASTRVRMTEWRLAVHHFFRQPILGTGYGFGLEFFDPFAQARVSRWWFIHNSYLFFLLKMGVVGLASFLWIVFVFFRETGPGLRAATGPGRVMLAGFVANMVQLLAMATTNYTFFSAENTPYIAFLLGGALAICREVES